MNWQPLRDLAEPWATKSSDGYYAIAQPSPLFECFHIEALWAKPVSIGHGLTLDLAKQLCEHHNAQPRT